MASTDVTQTIVPVATKITLPQATPIPSVPRPSVARSTHIRIPRSVQLKLARSLTFGVLGDDSQLYPSSRWVSENRDNYAGKGDDSPSTKPAFVITSLDTRKHNPQSKQVFHIKRINKKPVCNVQSWNTAGEEYPQNDNDSSEYMTSYPDKVGEPGNLVHKQHKNKPPAEGIVPLNYHGKDFDVRSEMMLPVCDSTVIPSAHNPHRYLLRKRKVPPPFRAQENCVTHSECGIVYPNLEHPRMTSYYPGMIQTGALPFVNENPANVSNDTSDRISVSSLSGQDFSRRKYIQPPMGYILGEHVPPRAPSPVCVSSLAGKKFTRRRELQPPTSENDICGCLNKPGFDGGASRITSSKFDDKYLPFMRAKTII